MKNRIICLAVSLMIFVSSLAHAFTLSFEEYIDRPGCDYRNFAVPNHENADLSKIYAGCMDACGLDSSCQAWNFDA